MQYALIEINTEPCFDGLPEVEKVLAVSKNSDKLYEHCMHKYRNPPGKPERQFFGRYYVVRETNIEVL